uniref:Uncharacterized protein n=1 Tax=Setaria viridis TaxID=4556 RepID=A0A4U6VY07_SETVI|nr:hypothetical protein SEVIR_2G336200v2 [Setaria viridis]TKW34891.1 hypothetical protein SEVIR_2G336200v2 [Setaria viridis]
MISARTHTHMPLIRKRAHHSSDIAKTCRFEAELGRPNLPTRESGPPPWPVKLSSFHRHAQLSHPHRQKGNARAPTESTTHYSLSKQARGKDNDVHHVRSHVDERIEMGTAMLWCTSKARIS